MNKKTRYQRRPWQWALRRAIWGGALFALSLLVLTRPGGAQELTQDDWVAIRALEQRRMAAIDRAMPSVVAIYGLDRQGGGSGVVIHPNGYALTNHHVIMGAGVAGWGGMSDGNLYPWKLVGTDPGGDVALIQLSGRQPFPYTELADSDLVETGDWAIAMGNPFILTEDQSPTITLGIVSGVRRYQPGAGDNQLIYGNCIQIDSSINPGNSGGPLFNLDGRIIGINGRGSFQDRQRVNVGLGYAISTNQIKNFLPDLMATKLVEHGTLDANFTDINGQVTCSTINELSRAAQAGLSLGDRLLEFEGYAIDSANQFTNLICTLPAGWPAVLKVEKPDGRRQTLAVRLAGLPYSRPPQPKLPEEPTPEQQKQIDRQLEMIELLRAEPGTVRDDEQNRCSTRMILDAVTSADTGDAAERVQVIDRVVREATPIGRCVTTLDRSGRLHVLWEVDGRRTEYGFDGEAFWQRGDAEREPLTLTQAKLKLPIVQAMGLMFRNRPSAGFSELGDVVLDGSGKSAGRPAARLKFLDPDQDWFYCWVGLPYAERGVGYELLKASADLSGASEAPGVTFSAWQPQLGWALAGSRQIVSGLTETVALKLEMDRVTEVPEDEAADLLGPVGGGDSR